MTDTPSLALLKGQNAENSVEDQGVDGPIEAADDILKASSASLENLLKENDTIPPAGWSSMKLADKRAWVLAKLEEGSAEDTKADPPFTPDAPKTAETPAAAPAKGKGKGKKSKDEPAPATVAATPAAEAPAAEAPAETPAPVTAEATAATNDAPTPQVAPAEPEKPKPVKVKGKKAGTDVAIAGKTGEIMEKDILQDIVHEVENMKKETALGLVAELSEQTDVAFFRLGGILSLVASNSWWKDDAGKYETFRAYIEEEHGLEYRKATYWISIYNALAKSGVPWSKVKEVGWTKLKEIAKVLTPENVDTWVDKAKEVNTLTLHDMVKKDTDKEKDAESGETEKVTTKTFKVHAGQKEVIEAAITKAKQTSGTEVDTVALERICQDYLAGSNASSLTPAQQLASAVKGLTIDVAMHIVAEAYPDFDFQVDKKDEADSKAA